MSTRIAHRIVIVGGGAGGLELATRLGQRLGRTKKARITLVDANLTHIWKPLLHEVAAGTINSFEDELNYFAHGAKHHFEFQLGRMERLDRAGKRIQLAPLTDARGEVIAEGREVSYDTLVLAIGSTANDFGTAGAHDHCVFLDSRGQADRFHRLFLNMYLKAHAESGLTNASPELNIAIVGAGATGVELAAELHHASHEFVKYGLDEIHPTHVNISLIEAADRILPALPENVSRAAHAQLERLGIKVYVRQKITKICERGLQAESGLFIPASLKVWSAGIKAPDFLREIDGLESNRSNQLVVTPTLQTTRDEHIFAIGDCAHCLLPDQSRPVPPRAQSAHQMASHLVEALSARLSNKTLPTFRYTDHGSLISLSTSNTVGHVSSVSLQGRIARLMYLSLYRMHQYKLHGFFKTFVLWSKDMLSRQSRPALKLH